MKLNLFIYFGTKRIKKAIYICIKLIIIIMAETYNLNGLQDNFKKLLADKKKAALKSLQFILQMNRQVGFDQILIREGYQSYNNKSQLEKNKTFNSFELFFKQMIENLDSIQQTYLKQSNDKELIEKASKQNKNQFNFLLNKNNISKFIRDQAVHYQKVLDLYLQDTGNEEKGIKSTKMHLFFIELFKNKYISIIKNNTQLIDSSSQQISVYIGNILLNYSQKAKEMTSSQTFNEFTINEEEILDFLTFWLKQQVENSLFVLYARTKQRLEQQSKILINKSTVKAQIHPSRMTKKQITEIEKAQQENPFLEEQKIVQDINTFSQKYIQKTSEKQKNLIQTDNLKSIELSNSKVEQINWSPIVTQLKKQVNKEQILQKELKSLFEFGCKRRYKLNKNTTFDQLQYQRKTMDLQKFMNFCNFFQLNILVNKQLLSQYFKIHAINTRIIDFIRFQQIIKKIIKNNTKIIDNLLNKSKYENKSRLNLIKRNKKLQNKLSNYQFRLMPVNGKDVSTIQKDLEFRKLQKQIEKQEKEQRALFKREHHQITKIKIIRGKSNLSQAKISTIQLQSIRDTAFNPENFNQSNTNDQLWDIYEAKIWKKEQKLQKSILQTLLSKRINRGTEIIKKINSQRSFLTE